MIYTFCDEGAQLPASVDAIPSLISYSLAPTKLDVGKSLGQRASITLSFRDHPHNDSGVDKYFATRSYTPLARGTFWGKLRARNPYYQGRVIRVRSGYITSPWDWNNFEDRVYVIEKIDGPDASGIVKITAKDLLKLVDDKRAQVPTKTSGALVYALTPTDTVSITLTTGTGSQYDSAGYVRVGEEIIRYTSRSGDVLSALTRGQFGSDVQDHAIGDSVQMCTYYNGENVVDVVTELLSAIPDAYIDTAGFAVEQDRWFNIYSVTRLISQPTGVTELLNDICAEVLMSIWWDEKASLVRMAAIAPVFENADPTDINDDEHIILGSLSSEDDATQRISQVWYYYDKKNATSDDEGNYKSVVIAVDAAAESSQQYNESRIKKVKCKWVVSDGIAKAVSGRILRIYRDNPRVVKFSMDAKDGAVWTNDVIDLTTIRVQDVDGSAKTERMRITSVKEAQAGTRYEYTAIPNPLTGRYAFVAPTGTPDYGSATDEQKRKYAFVDQGYKII